MSNLNIQCRKCRHEGEKLFLKGERCISPKCAVLKRPYAPGAHGTARQPKLSDYGKQLLVKQKAKAIYGVRETQFRNYYDKASKTKEATGEKLLQLLETRLDNVVFKLGFTSSLRQARQLVGHGKILVNGKKLDIPSYQLREKEKIEPIKKEGFKLNAVDLPVWLKLEKGKLIGEIIKIPSRDEIVVNIDEGLIVEFYSR